MAEQAAARRYPDADVVDRWTGAELVGRRYRRPFELLPLDESGQRVVAAEFVDTEEGSGIVHLAPAFGEDDATIGRAEGLPVLNPVNADGAFDESVSPYAGRFVKDADRDIIADLAERGLLVAEEPYEHSYPHCWRCGTPLIYWAKTSWFVRTSEHRTELLRENERIGWHPEHIKHGRFGKWLEGNIDWALSRDRYWGTPLPVWRCAQGHDTCIGSVAELSAAAGRDLADLDLHRPYVDDVTLPCPTCGDTARRLTPVLDAWFDSGSMPSAQHHYPFEGRDAFESSFPADFICEAIDQTRGWFYSLLAINTLVFDSTAYKNVVCLNLVVDPYGQKMSKSKGNVIDPWAIFARFGADALRWYFLSAGSPWNPRRVSEEGILEASRKTLITLWNVFSFHVTYADLDRWVPPEHGTDGRAGPTHVLDRWILSELDDTIISVTDSLEQFDAFAADQPAGGVRRRPVELVRAAESPSVLEGQRPAGPCHAPSRAGRHHAAARPVLPVPGRGAVRHPHRRRVGAPRRLARTVEPARRGTGRRHDGGPSPGRAGPGGSHRGQGQGPSAALPCPAAAPGGRARRRGPGGDRRRAQREGARGHRHALRSHDLDRDAELPGVGPAARTAGQRDQGGAGHRRRIRPPPPARGRRLGRGGGCSAHRRRRRGASAAPRRVRTGGGWRLGGCPRSRDRRGAAAGGNGPRARPGPQRGPQGDRSGHRRPRGGSPGRRAGRHRGARRSPRLGGRRGAGRLDRTGARRRPSRARPVGNGSWSTARSCGW